jgi:TonB family protein
MRTAFAILCACASTTASPIANRAAPPLPPPANPICTVRASLDTGAVRHTIGTYRDALSKCASLFGGSDAQRVQATFTIGADGRVTNAEVGGAAHDLDQCVCNVVAQFEFAPLPPSAKSIVVTYPFVFAH